jgi:hypothetical protein
VNLRRIIPLVSLLVLACATSPSPPTTATFSSAPAATVTPTIETIESPSDGVHELLSGNEPLAPGRYTRSGFQPPLTFELEEGWFAGTLASGFFDVQQDRDTPDVIAVQFGRVENVVGADGATVAATSAGVAAEAIAENPGLEVLGESESRMSGMTGANLEVENTSESHAGILDVSVGRLGIDPGRRLWISLFDTKDGVLAIMVGGSVAQWDRALRVAEPVLESVVIGE